MTPETLPETLIEILGLEPHPEGGFYTRTYRHARGPEGRGFASAIYYLLEGPDFALWHTTDGDEIWHWYAGAPLILETADEHHQISRHTLGTDLMAGERPQFVVPGNQWQRACSLGAWTLCGCSVSPGFIFETVQIAPADWQPGDPLP